MENRSVRTQEVFNTAPAVFAVGETYQIMVTVREEILFWVEIGKERFYDHSNGVLKSKTRIHRATVPMSILDRERQYTLCYRRVTDRKASFPQTGMVEKRVFSFRPVPEGGNINIYQIADAHQIPDLPIKAGRFFSDDLHLLILNGDLFDECNQEEDFDYIYQITAELTKGELPVVFTKGNHDNRGYYAEKMAEYTPVQNNRSYYSFRLGRIWGLILDCGECCADDYPEYGNTVCHNEFRRQETEYIKEIIQDAANEYNKPGIDYRFIIVHSPITHIRQAPYDIERELYSEWTALINKNIQPDLIISGHLHITQISYPGGPLDTLGQSCPVIIGARPVRGDTGYSDFIGCAITIKDKNIQIRFTNCNQQVLFDNTIKIN